MSIYSTDETRHDTSGAPLQEAAIRRQLDVILASEEFSASRRSSLLLRHIVERALSGDLVALKERSLGTELFYRAADYDTGGDAIVRVTAAEVRRRLLNFATSHPDLPVYISLRRGSYVPVLSTCPLLTKGSEPERHPMDQPMR